MGIRSRTTTIAAAAAVALLLTSCGGTSGTAESPSTGGADKGAVAGTIEVTWWGGDQRNKLTNEVVDMFVKENPGVTVDRQATDWPSYWTKLNVQAASKSLPCVVQLQGRQLNDYTKSNVLMPLDPMIDSGAIDVSGIPKAVVDVGRGTDGKLYFLPYGVAYDAVGVNTVLAEQAGADLPAEGYDWNDYISFLTKAQPNLPQGVAAADSRGGLTNFFIGWTQANGKKLFAKDGTLGFSKKDLIGYWNMWEKLRKANVTMSADKTAEEPAGPDQGYFATGQVMADAIPGNALTPASNTLAGTDSKGSLTTLAYPSGPNGSGNALFPSGFAISSNCQNAPTAAAFINYFTNDPSAGKVFAADNGAPSNTKVLDAQLADASLSVTKKHELELYKQIVAAKPPIIVFPPKYQATFETSFTRNYEEVAFGRMTVSQAVDSFFDEANASLGQ